mgnify:CR=1 FL=1
MTNPQKTPMAIISGSVITAFVFLFLKNDTDNRAEMYEEIIKIAILIIRRVNMFIIF